VQSSLSQSHHDVEVIVVDDGSTDDSAAVLEPYAARGVNVVFQVNRGQAGAINAGYALATGELVIFLDADDVLLPGTAAAAVAAVGEGIAHVNWRLAEIDSTGRLTGEITPLKELDSGELLPVLLSSGPLQWSSSGLGGAWTRPYLEQVMPIPEADFRIGADAYLVALAPLYGRVASVGRPLTLYRRHGANHSNDSFDRLIRFDVEIASKLFAHAARRARGLGHAVSVADWERRSWSVMVARAIAELDRIVGAEEPFVLVDGMELSLERSSGRAVIPFLERDGMYWGEPEHDDHAIGELDRLRREGARFLVLAWPSFWWIDAYPDFLAHLRGTYPCLLDNERLKIFELAAAP
jgi:glycosyltransferase involved in cell wall biosynthesis